MTITELRESQRNLRAQLDSAIQTGLALAQRADVSFDELNQNNDQVNTLRARLQNVSAALADAESAGRPAPAANASTPAMSERGRRLRATREYHTAFGKCVRMGLTPGMPCPNDNLQILYDALTETGGTPVGEDGGFLVPEALDAQIPERQRQMNGMRELVSVENTNTTSGSRVTDNAPTTGLTKLTGELEEIDTDDQPAFVRQTYTVDTYGLLLPVSRELLNDNTANLIGYIARWYAKKQLLTENSLIKGMLELLTADTITPDDDKNAIMQIRTLLNVALDPAISLGAKIVTNQSGFDYLDSLVDGRGRPLLDIDPVSGRYKILHSREVVIYSDAQLPNRVGNNGSYLPLYVGDGKEFGTLMEREGLEYTSTDIGAGSFERNGVTFRGLTRLGVLRGDTDAMVRREIFIAD